MMRSGLHDGWGMTGHPKSMGEVPLPCKKANLALGGSNDGHLYLGRLMESGGTAAHSGVDGLRLAPSRAAGAPWEPYFWVDPRR